MAAIRPAVLLRALAHRSDPQHRVDASRRVQALQILDTEQLLRPGYSYRFVPIDADRAGMLSAGGEVIEAPWLVPQSGTLTAIACGVATVGEPIEACVRKLFERRQPALALALDSLGNELLVALSRLMQDRMLTAARRRGLTMAGELRPGDSGLDIGAQRAVLGLAGAASIGVGVNGGGVMSPMKSVSMVLGVGVGLPRANWSRCDQCPTRPKCRMAA